MKSVLSGVQSRGFADLLQLAIGIAVSLFSVTFALMPMFAFAQGPAIVTPGQLVWRALIPNVEMAVVSGDLEKKGSLYLIRIRSKGEAKVPPHRHPTDEHVTVLAGSFLIARGEKYEASKLIELKAGARSVMPAGTAHFGLHKAGNVVEVYGEGPFAPDFVNPEDDPSKA